MSNTSLNKVSGAAIELRIHSAISEIPAAAWDALAGEQIFLRHAFLAALESSGCLGPATGWLPAHAALWQADRLLAAAPMYAKKHSYGEYVFDWAWAEAYAQHGLAYYPKWLCAIPFSPVPGMRLLAHEAQHRQQLLQAMLAHAKNSQYSSLHILFHDQAESLLGQQAGMLARESVQFHWQNNSYRHFEDFLAQLSHDKRKKIRQERRKVAQAGVSMQVLEGQNISYAHWQFFTRCYHNTYAAHQATPYLNFEFFWQLGQRLPEGCVLIVAQREGRDIAASLLLRDQNALYGRYWGAIEPVSCLHFEACYYAPIEYAIEQGLQRFEGGAQGEHKLARGLEPVLTHSLHWLADERFVDAIGRYLARESRGVALYVNELEQRLPFKQADV